MAFDDLERKQVERAAEAFLAARRPPAHLRDQVDLACTVADQTIELLEVRPRWDAPGETMRRPFAKARLVRTTGEWRVYWMRGNLKWHAYDPHSVPSAAHFFALVEEDRNGCFFG